MEKRIKYDDESGNVIMSQSIARDIVFFMKGHEAAIARSKHTYEACTLWAVIDIQKNFECPAQIKERNKFLLAVKEKANELAGNISKTRIQYDEENGKVTMSQSTACDIANFITGHEAAMLKSGYSSEASALWATMDIQKDFICSNPIKDGKKFIRDLKSKVKELTGVKL